jgi:hypothetical protein
MSVTINAKGTSTGSFKIGKNGTVIDQSGTITPPADSDLIFDLGETQYLEVRSANSAPGRITTSGSRDLHIDPSIGGGQDLYLNENKWPSADGLAGQVLTTNGSGVLSFSSVTATNISGGTAGGVVYQSAPDTTAITSAGTQGQVLQSNGSGAPTWQTPGLENYFLLMGA